MMKYPAGADNIKLSVRSSKPPIPGMDPPESFMPASLFNTDAIKSPMTDTSPMTNPQHAPCEGSRDHAPKSKRWER